MSSPAPDPPPDGADTAPATQRQRVLRPPPPLRAHWAILAAGLVCFAALQWLDRAVSTGPITSAWWFSLSSLLYVLSIGLIAAGVVGWLLARYLRLLAADQMVEPEPQADGPPASSAEEQPAASAPTPSPRPGRPAAPPHRPPDPPAADDDHSLWRP